jgi:NitT/TauT family transport system substrate-binding protein
LAPKRVLAALVLLLGACGRGGAASERTTLRLGHLPNITHATAIAGIEKGIFAKHLRGVDMRVQTFNAGTQAVQGLFAGGLDAAYLGPSPAINAHARSDGRAVRIIAGAASGGAFFVVQPEIKKARHLRGRTVSSPQLGNTQDVALRSWLADQGLETDLVGGGDVRIQPQENAQILETFRARDIAGAWVAEPWATRMIEEGGGKVLVDERDLWPKGEYVTTHLLVRTGYLKENPQVVERLLGAHLAADTFVRENDDEARSVVNEGIEKITDKALPDDVLDAAWENLTFTVDPIASSLERSAAAGVELGLLEDVDLQGIYALDPLNELLAEDGREPITGL